MPQQTTGLLDRIFRAFEVGLAIAYGKADAVVFLDLGDILVVMAKKRQVIDVLQTDCGAILHAGRGPGLEGKENLQSKTKEEVNHDEFGLIFDNLISIK